MTSPLSRIGKQWTRCTAFAALALMLPLVLAACGDTAVPTSTTGAGATTAATKPASTTVPAASAAATTAATTGAAAGAPTAGATATTGATGATAAATTGAATTGATAATTGAATTAMTAAAGTDPRGVAPTKRGGGGTLHLLWWQAPTILNEPLAQGTKDSDAARLISEPLASISLNSPVPDVPALAKEIPTTQNGELAMDGKSVTWKLKDGVVWSDGTPFTSADVKATWQYVIKPENGAVTVSNYENVDSIDTPDATTVKVNFKTATSIWYAAFVNVNGVILQKAQTDKCNMDPKSCAINSAPVGTGPYVVKSFTPNDNVQYVINAKYREANAPYFDAVDLKGGGDAATAAKAVQTGAVDYGWNLQVTPDISKQVTDSGKILDQVPGFGIEHIIVNFTDPNKEVDGEKSSVKAPHPFLTDPKVREAMSYLMDRDGMAKGLYPAGKGSCNFILGIPPQVQSKNTKCSFDVAKANQILEDAGYKKGPDGIRAKGGVKLTLVFGSSVNSVREKEEQIIKQAFQQAGIGMEIKNADAGVYFGQPDNPDAASRGERDLLMLTRSSDFPDMQKHLSSFLSTEIVQKSNGWKGNNYGRWNSPEFDALYKQLAVELNPEKRAALEIQLNDLVIQNNAIFTLVDRYSNNGHRADLINTAPSPWESNLWNIAYWQIKK